MICQHCKTENRDEAKFCNECGMPLLAATLPVINGGEAPFDEETSEDEEASIAVETPLSSEDIDEMLKQYAGVDKTGDLSLEELILSYAGYDEEPCGEEVNSEFDLDEVSESDDEVECRDDASDDFEDSADAEDASDLASISTDETANLGAGVGAAPRAAWRPDVTMEMEPVAGAASAESRTFQAHDVKHRNGNGRMKAILAVIIGLLVVAAICAFATYQMEMWGGHRVPDVMGLTEAEATSVLQGSGFETRTETVKSDDVEGLVLLTDPRGGARQTLGSEVVIHVSATRYVPQVVGLPLEEAQKLLDEEGFTNVEIVTQKSDAEENAVLAIVPEAGVKAKSTQPVSLTVADPYRVPAVVGWYEGDAYTKIQQEGFTPDYQSAYDYDTSLFGEGQVVWTYPEADTKLASGSYVTMGIARSRANELLDITRSLFQNAGSITVDGIQRSFDINTLNTNYEGSDVVSYSVDTVYDETVYFSNGKSHSETFYETLVGTIQWNGDNTIAYSAPNISFN